ncbi:hypothetical protein D9757_007247 [Collybiopsis confluens]|uniref:Nucleolar pre-ribosomal-associated protein 1 n=1 Tax=Collybiopsis confluens TaxID=2823264 RepID=A0A8H5HB86_9AGAR|nr:hypothetical protein D9757_007247 [Collybiopsis confluens]
MSPAGPSRKRIKADVSEFSTPADIDKALTTQGSADELIKGAFIQSQFHNHGAHQNVLQLWLQSTAAEALLTLWDNLESEGAYGKVLSTLLSLFSSILRFISTSPERDSRLPRSMLSTQRLSKLNTYLSGKNFSKNASGSQNAGLVAETLNLLAVLVDWDAKTVLESVRWDMESFPRILRGPRKDWKGKGKEKIKAGAHADSRPRTSLLSLITAILAQDVSARVKSAFLSTGTPTLTLLRILLSGLGDSYQNGDPLYSYIQTKTLLETLYAGVWCDKRVARSIKIAVFAFGHTGIRNGNDNLMGGRKPGQAGGEKVWKGSSLSTRGLSSNILSRTVQKTRRRRTKVVYLLISSIIFLLALCTRPGQGVCFRDQGWYLQNQNDQSPDPDGFEDAAQFNLYPEEDGQNPFRRAIHNPLLLRLLRLLTPSVDLRQQELATRILEACPELVASSNDVISGGPGSLDPRLNARWMASMAWYGRVVGLPVPEETFYLPSVNGGQVRMPRVAPPPLRTVVETLMGSAAETGGSSVGARLGLVQLTIALTLCRCLEKYLQVKAAFLRAGLAAGETESVELDDSLSLAKGSSGVGAWSKRLAEANKEIRSRLPDIQVILAFPKRIESAAAAVSRRETSTATTTTSATNPTALALLSESAYRVVWLYHVCLLSNSSSLSNGEEGSGRFDVVGLVASLSIVSAEVELGEATGGIDGLRTMKDVHILRTLRTNREFGSRVFAKAGKQTHLHLLLRALARGSLLRGHGKKAGDIVLQSEIHRLLEQVLSNSVLFRRSEGENDRYRSGPDEEVRIWLSALSDSSNDVAEADTAVAFLDDCAQRCMRAPERYLDALDEVRDASVTESTEANSQTQSGLPSPLLMTMLEQLDHRIFAVSTEEQQQSSIPDFSASPSFRSLCALLAFIRHLFIRLAALCETRTLPVLWALVVKMTTGKSFENAQGGVRTIECIRKEVEELQRMLRFGHGEAEESVVAQDIGVCFEVFYVLGRLKNLEDSSWCSTLAEKVFGEYTGNVEGEDSAPFVTANIFRAVRLVSHTFGAKSREVDGLDTTRAILSLLTQIMHKLDESNVLSVVQRHLVKEYVFRGNDVLRRLWTDLKGQSVHDAIETFLKRSLFNAGDPVDRLTLAEITEHWVAQLHLHLESAQSTSVTQACSGTFMLRYADPHALCELFDSAYARRDEPGRQVIATDVIVVVADALKSHAESSEAVEFDVAADSSLLAPQLRIRLAKFLSLSVERINNPVMRSLDPEVLERLILHATRSHLPLGYDGRIVNITQNSPVSLHHRRRERWRNRLESRLPDSDIFERRYLASSDVQMWSRTTVDVICNAIYCGFIQSKSLNSWIVRLSKATGDGARHLSEILAPIGHAILTVCVYVEVLLHRKMTNKKPFQKACEVYFSALVDVAFRVGPALSTEIQEACGSCLGILLELINDTSSAWGQTLTASLVEHIRNLSVDGMSLELLMVGKKAILGLTKGVEGVAEAVVDHALQWVVRMLVSSRDIGGEDIRLLSEMAELVSRVPSVKPHLAEPVLTAVIREHPQSEVALQLLELILPKAHLKPLTVNRHLQMLVQYPHFAKMTTPATKHALANVLYTLFHLHPVNTCQPSHVQPLIALYGGSASVADRKILAIFHLFEEQRRMSIASLFSQWSPLPGGFQSSSALEALRNVDSLLVLRTALNFPQWRALEGSDASGHWEERPEGSEIYDPVFLLLLFAHVLAEEAPQTVPGWVEFFRTNIVGLVIRALSAKDASLREIAVAQIAVLWKCLENTDMIEKQHVLHIFNLLRDALRPTQGQTPERLPSYTTLLLVHALRGVFYPSNFVYPITARFLLQRPTLDIGDVPMLYSMLYSSAEEHGKKDRAWIIRMLADGMQSSTDWRVFKRRHTWDLLASVFQSEEKERALRRGVLEVLANLTCVTQAIMSLLLKSSLLTWIEMQLLAPQEEEGLAWLKILENLLTVADTVKLESATSGEWRASMVRCLILLLDGCTSLHTFPIFNLMAGTVLRLALLPSPVPVQMPQLLERCVKLVNNQEISAELVAVSWNRKTIFNAPHGAFRLFEVPQLSPSVLLELRGESIERLWRVAMLMNIEQKIPAWDELTSLLLVWRAQVGDHSVEGEWARRQVVRSITNVT